MSSDHEISALGISTGQLRLEETKRHSQDFLRSLESVERRAILPLKWVILVVAVGFWMLGRAAFIAPPTEVFSLFTAYFMGNLGLSYFFYVRGVPPSQVWRFCLVSYLLDVLFVTALVFLDARMSMAAGRSATDFYILFFILILRGFALFRNSRENLAANVMVGAVFVASLLLQETAPGTPAATNNLIRIVFIFLVILMSAFIVDTISHQLMELGRVRENLIRSENMALLGELAAGVAHEINNPIAIISANAEYLKKKAPPGDPRAEDFEIIRREAERCGGIVRQLLSLARPARSERRPMDLRATADEVLEFLFPRTGAGEVRVERQYSERAAEVPADSGQIKQALLNVLLNSRQALPQEGGVLTVKVEPSGPSSVRIEVADNGKGIKPEHLAKVFDPFFTTRSKGTGLGLSIVRRIVEDHDGQLGVESEPGKGTRVWFDLPAAKGSGGAA